jgi:hypothetical protein
VYETRVVNHTTVTRVSYNGGNGGLNERPTTQEESASLERHVPPVAAQAEHVQAARTNTELRASANHGKPPVAATSGPGELKGGGVVATREGGAVHEPTARPENSTGRGNPPVHPNDLPRTDRSTSPNTGNVQQDQKYQQQQEKLQAKQDQERQKLQQKQDQQHQKLDQQKANDTKRQQLEQQHQQQTQQLQQKHVQEQQRLQQRQQPPPHPAPARPSKP